MLRTSSKATKVRSKKQNAQGRAQLRRTTREILKLKRSIASGFYRLGRLLVEVRERELWRAGGYSSLDDYLSRGAKFERSPRSAYKYMRIAETFAEATALRFGPEKLDRMLAYVDATPANETPQDILQLTIPVSNGEGELVTKSVDEATSREIARATRAKNASRREKALGKLPGSSEADRLVGRARAALGRAKLDGTKVVVVPGDGEPKLSIHNIRLPNASRTFAVLAEALGAKRAG